MKIGNLSGGIGMVDVVSRFGGLGHGGRPRHFPDGKVEKVNNATAKDKSGTSTDKGRERPVVRRPQGH